MRRVGARAQEHAVDLEALERRARAEPHVLERPRVRLPVGLGRRVGGIGDPLGDLGRHARIRPPGDLRAQSRRVDRHDPIVLGSGIGSKQLPPATRVFPRLRESGPWAALQVREGGVVGCDQAGAGAGLDGHVADGHPSFHRQVADGVARVLDDVPGGALGPDAPDEGEDQVLRRDPRGRHARESDLHRLRPRLDDALGRQHVLDLAGPDPEGERAERAVGRRVRVAADDDHAGLGEAELGADHVHDALLRATRGRTARPRTPARCSRAPPPGGPRSDRRWEAGGRRWARCGRRWPP